MTIRKLKISTLFFSSLFIMGTVKTILACSGEDDTSDAQNSVFAPEIIRQPAKAPFFLSFHSYYSLEQYAIPETIPTLTDRNTAEWAAFFKNKLSTEAVEWLIYGSTVSHLELLKKGLADKEINIDTLNQSVVAALRKQKRSADILDYIILAKTSEKYFNPNYDSWYPLVYDSAAIQYLIPVCRERFTQAGLPFLKQRYGFQLTRALSVSGRNNECIRFYDSAFNPPASAASMFLRSLGYKARSLYKLQQYSLANYLYAYLFNADPCQRYMAYQSFHPQEEEDWNATLLLAKTTAEKESLWELFGLYADPVRAIKELYAINPQSNSLPLLLVRSVNIAEERLLLNPVKDYTGFYDADYTAGKVPDGYNINRYSSTMIDSASSRTLLAVIEHVIEEKKTDKLPLWQLSAAYLYLLHDDYIASSAMLSTLPANENDSLLLGQAAIIEGILAVRKLTSIDAVAENDVYKRVQRIDVFSQPALRKENALRYMMSSLSLVYSNKNDLLKKELAYPQGAPYYLTAGRTEEMIVFINRKDLQPLEKYLVRQYPLTLTDLHDVKAVAYMYEYNFTAAVNEFSKAPALDSSELNANPFTIHIVDCHECDDAARKARNYTKYNFAKKMIELKAKGDSGTNKEDRAKNYFLYANGIYNMTWYGNSRVLYGTRVAGTDYSSVMYGNNKQLLRKSNFFQCGEALKYYQQAFALSNNKEFKAKCIWMSARCEHNLWLDEQEDNSSKDFIAGQYFKQMKNSFSNTEYYKEVIHECGYFCKYVTGSDSCKRNR